MYLEFDKHHGSSSYQRFLLTPKLFVFFYSSSLGCLMPFLTIFFRLNGMSSIQTGLLLATRYLILSWSASTLSFIASKMNARKCVLVLAVLFGALANMAFLFTATYQKKTRQNCAQITGGANHTSVNSSRIYYRSNYEISDHPFGKILKDSAHFQVLFNSSTEQEIFEAIGLNFNKQFLTFFLIVAAGTFMSSPAKPLHELVSLAIIKEYKANYSMQRLSSVLGWSVMSLAVAVVVYNVPCSFKLSQNVFNLHFCFHLLFATTAVIFAMTMKVPPHKVTAKLRFCRVLNVSVRDPNCIVAIVTMAILGTAQFVVSSYLFWYVQDIGGNELHMGLIVLTSGLSQIPLLFVTKYLIHWLGHGWMLFLSMFGFAARFMLYSYTTNPMMFIPIELLHAFTSSSIWLTSMSLAVLVAPIGFERSMQNLFTASYYGLGMGFGGILVSIGYHFYGPVQVFVYAAAICVLYSFVLGVLQCLISPPDEHHGFPINGDYYKTGVGNNQSDWLLDALNAEEEEIHYSRS